MTTGLPPSSAATTEFVVPRSMPITLPMAYPSCAGPEPAVRPSRFSWGGASCLDRDVACAGAFGQAGTGTVAGQVTVVDTKGPLIGAQVVPRQKSVTVQKTHRSLSRRKARTVSGNGRSPWEAGGRVAGLNILFLSGGHRNTAREVLQRYVGQDAPSIATKLPTPQSAAVEARFVWLDGGQDYRRIA